MDYILFKNIVKLVFSGAGGQAIQFLALPLLTFLFSAEELGIYFSVLAISSIVTIIISLQLQHAIPTCTSEKSVQDSISFTITLSLISVVFLYLIFSLLEKIFGLNIIISLPIGFFSALVLILKSLNIRNGEFNNLSFAIFFRGLIISGLQIAFGYLDVDDGLLYGLIVGEAICAIILTKGNSPIFSKLFSRGFLGRAWLNHREFFLVGSIQEVISTMVFYAPIILMPIIFDLNQAGQFGFAHRLIWPIVILVNGSLISALYSEFGKKDSYNFKKFLKSNLINYIFIIFSFIFLSVFSKFFFVEIFGNEWTLAGEISWILVLWAGSFLLSGSFRAAVRMFGFQRVQLYIDISILILIFFVSLFFYFSNGNLNSKEYVMVLASLGVGQNILISYFVYKRV